MPSMCVAFGCFNRGGHRFPKDETMKKKWLAALKRKYFVPKAESRVCGDHFLDSDYLKEGFDSGHKLTAKKSLRKDAVPSIFSWKKQLNLSLATERDARLKRREDRSTSASLNRADPSDSEHALQHSIHTGLSPAPEDGLLMADRTLTVVSEIKSECINVSNEVEIETNYGECVSVASCDDKKSRSSACTSSKLSGEKKQFHTEASSVSVSTQTHLKSAFCFDKLAKNPEAVLYYTGLESFEKLILVLQSLGPAAYELNYRYSVVENVSVEDQFLMTLVKLRRAIPDFGLAFMFDVSKKTVQNICVTWINFMYHEWSNINIWPSKDLIMYYMPEGFKRMYPSTRVIVDGTEFPIAAPKNPVFQQAAFSTYKNRTTLKTLVGVTPSGLISHCSPAFAGSVSDRAIVERSDLIEKCDPGDSIMADRGFTVQDLFAPKRVTVNIPAFMKGKSQLPGVTLLKDRKLASKRVHVERVIGLVKTYTILKHELPAHYVPLGTQIFSVVCMLCNFREGIVGRQA